MAWKAGRPGDSAVEILSIQPALIRARVRLVEERLLASSVYQDGGWHLLLDGHPFRMGMANGPFLGAWLPADEHRLDLVYRAPGLIPGLALAAMAVAGTVLWLLGPYTCQTDISSSPFRRRSGTSASEAG